MTHCKIILLHHSTSLLYSVLDQFEQSIISSDKNFSVIQSKRKLASFITLHSLLSMDVSRIVSDFAAPPLVIMKSYNYGNGINSNLLLTFHDYFVKFNRVNLLEFASKHFKQCKASKTCLIQLFDESEAKFMIKQTEMANVYGFLTRLYCSAFPTSHHIHLFAKHRRATEEIGSVKHKAQILKVKGMNVLAMNNGLKNYHLTSFTSMKILSYLLSTIVHKNKVPPMMAMHNMRLKMSKAKLIRNVVREIRMIYAINNEQCIVGIADLVNHILKIDKNKYQSNSALRTSYAT